ncbi:hypothetical protein ATK36_5170 [Amycolatopsis sulphurea]|uniref:Uncharacterized protein n=1 Tax=Amycolatopsis sulphurea TaxID=76022 RepID=A0A2A9FGS9_9PSEU|nr:hypothetical protein [Amycolatopsis sulphurea]PFG49976.1 hypothetical protein ATK36_5170 [Amycolatopsis sulphurea]
MRLTTIRTDGGSRAARVDGAVKQRSSTDQRVFSVARTIYPTEGKVVRCTIEGLGTQTTRCVSAATDTSKAA